MGTVGEAKKIFAQGFPAEAIAITLELLAGFVLVSMASSLEKITGLLILMPAFLEMRGDISGSYSSRLGTALHQGIIAPELTLSDELKQNLLGAYALTLAESLLIGFAAYAVCLLLGFPNPSLPTIVAISLLAGVLSSVLMTGLVTASAIFVYSKGLDPDTVLGPYINTMGDVVGMLSLFLAVLVVGGWL